LNSLFLHHNGNFYLKPPQLRFAHSSLTSRILESLQQRQNKPLRPTATDSFVPHYTYAAGEFRRCIGGRGALSLQQLQQYAR
jgi:hypothetical protein